MEGFDSDHPRRPKWRSSVSDENDLAYCGPGAWKTAARPSGSWKTTPPAKKTLGERNGSRDVDGGFRALRLCQSPSKVSESREGVFSLSPSDPSKNSPVPRPEFLRYMPDWRSKVLTRVQDGEDKKEIGIKRNSGWYFCDEEGSNSHGETDDEVEEGEEEEEEEEEEGDVGVSEGRKGLMKKLAWFALFLLSVSLYPIDISEVPAEAERINSYVGEVSSWPVHNLTHQAASENISAVMDFVPGDHSVLYGEREHDYDNEVNSSKFEEQMVSYFGDDHQLLEFEELSGSVVWDSGFPDDAGKDSSTGGHSVLSGEREHDCGKEVTLSKVEEEMWPNFGDDYQPLELREFLGSVIWDSGFVEDSQKNAAVDDEEEVIQSTEHGSQLSDSPTTLNLHVDLGKIVDEKQPSHEKHALPEDQDRKIAWANIMVMLSPAITFLISATLLLGTFLRRSSSNTFQPRATEEPYNGQHIVHSISSAELQSPTSTSTDTAFYQKTAPRTSTSTDSAFSQKHNPVPCVELLGEITFGEPHRSQESITDTKSQSNKQSCGPISPEKKFVSPTDGSTFRKQEVTPLHKCRLFHCSCSIGKSTISTDKGISGLSRATPTPLRRSSRVRNRAQSP